jgi:hypothetical protein
MALIPITPPTSYNPQQITLQQLFSLPKQTSRCPESLITAQEDQANFDPRYGVSTDAFFVHEWAHSTDPAQMMTNVVFFVKRSENRQVKVATGGVTPVTNLYVTNFGQGETVLYSWEDDDGPLKSVPLNSVFVFN